MAYTTIDKSSLHFNTKLYTGNGSAGNSITGVGFQPDWVWIKNRNSATEHSIFDAVRGANYRLASNNTDAQSTQAAELTAFGSDGFTTGLAGGTNGSGNGIASWNWKAGTTSGIATNGATVTTPSSYSFNQTSRFSILKYTGTGNTNNKLAHGLGVKPDFIIFKKTSGAINWGIYHQSLTADYRLLFTTGAKSDDDSFMQDSEPDSVNINLGYGGLNNTSGATYIAYCFADVQGFSKFGKYTGNGNADGAFIYTGFKVGWIMIKCSSTANDEWFIWDSKRLGYNGGNNSLYANTTDAESTATANGFDMLSNGFKLKTTDTALNGSGRTYIYMAFAEAPLVGSNNVPATAR